MIDCEVLIIDYNLVLNKTVRMSQPAVNGRGWMNDWLPVGNIKVFGL